MAFEGFFLAITVNLFAEIADKTQLVIMALSAKHGKPAMVYVSAMLGIALATLISVLAGGFIGSLISKSVLQAVAGIAFVAFAVYGFFHEEEEEGLKGKSLSFAPVFMLVFLSEISGDKSQIANLLLSTQFNWLGVFAGAMTAIMAIGIISVLLGKKLSEKLEAKAVKMLSSIVFLAAGLYFIALALGAL